MVKLPVGVKMVRLPVLPLAIGKEKVKTEIENNDKDKDIMSGDNKYIFIHSIIILDLYRRIYKKFYQL